MNEKDKILLQQLKRAHKGLKRDLRISSAKGETWFKKYNQQKKVLLKLIKEREIQIKK